MRPLHAFCLFAAALALAGAVATVPAQAVRARPASVGGAVVDVSRLRLLGLGPVADQVQATIARDLAASGMAGRVAVSITGLSMVNWAGQDSGEGAGGGRGSGGGSNYDYLEGDILLLGPGGQVVGQRHTVVSSLASSGAPYYVPGSEQRRIQALSRNFAEWARRLL